VPEISDTDLAALQKKADAADSAAAAAAQAATDADAARAALAAGVTRYADTVRAAHPSIPADAIAGDSFDAVDAAATSAQRIADAALAAAGKTPPASVPAGGAAPRNDAPNTDGMSPIQKVSAGLKQRAATGS